MNNIKLIVFVFFLSTCISGCSFPIELIIANNSQAEIIIKYTFPINKESSYFFKHPDTYIFADNLNKLGKKWNKNKPISVESNYSLSQDSTDIRILVQPGQAVHIGHYPSFLNRDSIITKYQLTVETGNGKPGKFEHLRNSCAEILTINKR